MIPVRVKSFVELIQYFFLKLKAKLDYSTVFRPSHCIEENGMGKYSKAKDFPNL